MRDLPSKGVVGEIQSTVYDLQFFLSRIYLGALKQQQRIAIYSISSIVMIVLMT